MGEGGTMQAAGEAFGSLLTQVAKVTVGIHGMSAVVSGAIDIFRSMKHVVDAATQAFSAVIGVVADTFMTLVKTITPLLSTSLDLGKSIENLITGIGNLIGNFIAKLGEVITSLVKAFVSLSEAIGKVITGFLQMGLAALPGGFKVLGQVMEYATTILGSVFTPVVFTLIAVVKTVVEMFKDKLLKATETVAEWLGKNLPQVIQTAVEWTMKVINAFDWLYVAIRNFGDRVIMVAEYIGSTVLEVMGRMLQVVGKIIQLVPGLGDTGKSIRKMSDSMREVGEKMEEDRKKRGDDIKKRNEEGDARNKERDKVSGSDSMKEGISDFMKNLGANAGQVLQSMRQSMAEKANVGFSSIADVQKTIQQQAFQSSIPAQQLDIMNKIYGIIAKYAGAIGGNQAQPAVGA